MTALRRIEIIWDNPPAGFRVVYEDTLRPNRTVIEDFPEAGSVSVGEAARITLIPRRTLYNWIHSGDLETEESDGEQYEIPLFEVRRLLEEEDLEEEEEDSDEEGDWEEE